MLSSTCILNRRLLFRGKRCCSRWKWFSHVVEDAGSILNLKKYMIVPSNSSESRNLISPCLAYVQIWVLPILNGKGSYCIVLAILWRVAGSETSLRNPDRCGAKSALGSQGLAECIHFFWLLLLEFHCLLEEASWCFPQLGWEQTYLAVKILTHKNIWLILIPLSFILSTHKTFFTS